MTDTSTEAVNALLEGVTKGPWTSLNADLENTKMHQRCGPVVVKLPVAPADCIFIAASRVIVPALLSERDAAIARAEAAEARVRELEPFRSEAANLLLTGDDLGDGASFKADNHTDQHECLEALIVKARALEATS